MNMGCAGVLAVAQARAGGRREAKAGAYTGLGAGFGGRGSVEDLGNGCGLAKA